MGGRQFKPTNKTGQHKPPLIVPVQPVRAQEAKPGFNVGDSIGFAALLLGVIVVAITPPVSIRAIALLVSALGCIYLARKSHWTCTWSPKKQNVVSVVAVLILLGIGVPQIVGQWRTEHPRQSLGNQDHKQNPEPERQPQQKAAASMGKEGIAAMTQSGTGKPPRQPVLSKGAKRKIIDGLVREYERAHPGTQPTNDDAATTEKWVNAQLMRRGYDFAATIRPNPQKSVSHFTKGIEITDSHDFEVYDIKVSDAPDGAVVIRDSRDFKAHDIEVNDKAVPPISQQEQNKRPK